MVQTHHRRLPRLVDSGDAGIVAPFVPYTGRRLKGGIIGPADAGYDEARAVYNGLHDRYPAVIVPCRTASDVAAGVRFAAEHDLDLAIRGGGHSGPGFGP